MFTLTANRRRVPGTRTHTLRLYCEQPGAWHQLPGDEGCYQVRELDPWLRAAAPHLNRICRVLAGAAQLSMPVLGIAAPDLHSRLTDDVANMRELLDQVKLPDDPLRDHRGGHGWGDPATRADDDADFRAIEHLLTTLDPKRRWGGLSRTTTPEGLTLYLCRDHAATYRAPSRRPTDL